MSLNTFLNGAFKIIGRTYVLIMFSSSMIASIQLETKYLREE